MEPNKQTKLEEAGWRIGTTEEFLGLSAAESAMIELKLLLSDALRARRTAAGVTQSQLARRLGSSQSRVAKMEAADSTVTMDLLVKAFLTLGGTPQELAGAISSGS